MTIYSIIEDIDQDNRSVQDSDSVTEWVIKQKTLSAIKKLYHDADFTVKDICTVYSIEYKPEYQKLFYNMFGPKGKGHGGARRSNSKL